jgi:hypothetical protein
VSDVWEGQGWWLASDGRWYPPEQRPSFTTPYSPPGAPAYYEPAPAGQPAAFPTDFASPAVDIATPKNGKRKKIVLIGVGVVALLFLIPTFVGISRTSSTDDVASKVGTTPSGYSEFADQADSFRIAVPASWHQVNLTSPGAVAAMQEIEANNPDLAALGSGSSLVAEGMKFFAINPALDASLAASVNVDVRPALGVTDGDLSQLAAELPGEYQRLGATLLGTTTISMAGHQALQATIELPINDLSGNQVTADEVQDFVAANSFVYVVTLTGTNPDLASIAATFSVQ